jgi:chromate reductase
MADAPITLVTLLGSLRKGSYNAMLMRTLPGLAPAGVTILEGPTVGGLPLYDADVQNAEGFPAGAEAIAKAVAAADGVVIVTPEYNYSVPGVLKNALDWVSRMNPQPFVDKPISIQTASMGAMGGVRCQLHLRQVLVFLRALAFTTPEVIVGAAQTKFAADGSLMDEPTKKAITAHLEAYAAFVRKHR